jgi:hypothetical protein
MVRITAVLSLFLVFSCQLVMSDTPPIARPLLENGFWFTLPFVIAYLAILRDLKGSSLRKGFALALSIGPLVFLVGLLTLVPTAVTIKAVGDVPHRVLVLPCLLPLMQIALTLGAIKGYRLLGSAQRGNWTTLARGIGAATLYLLIGLALSNGSLTDSRIAESDAAALSGIREIGDCAKTYYGGHPSLGYPSTLLSLGPGGEGCIDGGLARGSRAGHIFEYSSTTDDQGRRTGFTVTARPRKYGYTGGRSFLTDETEVIRATPFYENRAVTPKDPPL